MIFPIAIDLFGKGDKEKKLSLFFDVMFCRNDLLKK